MLKEARQSTLNRSVVIIGRSSLQNKLLSDLIEERTGYISLIRSVDDLTGLPIGANALALLDVEHAAVRDIITHLQALAASASCRNVALINVKEDVTFLQVAAWPGVKGVFFREASQENLLKGVQGILDGEYWLPRRILSAHLERTRMRQRSCALEEVALTPKEIETLKLLTSGNSNSSIARRLSVSLHTVKTHNYNVYRKIRVSNRVQAMQWALQNIDGPDRTPRAGSATASREWRLKRE
jgi:DNA-binding NarL/FixJ family response regulator